MLCFWWSLLLTRISSAIYCDYVPLPLCCHVRRSWFVIYNIVITLLVVITHATQATVSLWPLLRCWLLFMRSHWLTLRPAARSVSLNYSTQTSWFIVLRSGTPCMAVATLSSWWVFSRCTLALSTMTASRSPSPSWHQGGLSWNWGVADGLFEFITTFIMLISLMILQWVIDVSLMNDWMFVTFIHESCRRWLIPSYDSLPSDTTSSDLVTLSIPGNFTGAYILGIDPVRVLWYYWLRIRLNLYQLTSLLDLATCWQ